MQTPYQTKGQRTRTAIIDTAHKLFIEQGYHGTSMRQIAQEAGIALGGIYNHYESKESIFEAVLWTYHPYHRIFPAMQAAKGDNIEELIKDAARILLASLSAQKGFINLAFIEIVEFESQHITKIFESILPQMLEIADRITLHQSDLRPIPLPILLRAFLGLFFSHFITEIMLQDALPVEMDTNTVDYFVDIFLHGVLAGADNAPE